MPVTAPQIDTQEAYFTTPDGISLFRRSLIPAGRTWARFGIFHGYGDHGGRYRHFMEWLAERGVACHALDFRGHGRSEGKRGYAKQWAEYNDDAMTFLNLEAVQAQDNAPLFLLGHSNGGLILASTVLRRQPADLAGCIFSAPYFAIKFTVPPHLRIVAQVANIALPHLLVTPKTSNDGLTTDTEMQAEDRRDPLNFQGATPRWYLSSLAEQREILPRAAEWDIPTLLLLGGADVLVENQVAKDFLHRAKTTDKTVCEYAGLRHELLRETRRDEIYHDILRWLEVRAAPR